MGKASENEKIKLVANFMNNCGVGLVLGGCFLPLFAVFQRIPDFFGPISWHDLAVLVCAAIGGAMAAGSGFYMHASATKQLDRLRDD